MKFYDRNYETNKKVYDSDEMGYLKFVEEFIKQYEPPYFIENDPEKSATGRNIGQSCRLADEEMQLYLDKGITCAEDVIKILDWKIGQIDHKKSEEEHFVYYKDIPSNQFTVKNMYGKVIESKELCNYIADKYPFLNSQTPEEIYKNLLQLNVNGLGTVYLLTLVYFISQGESPIYDRFAHQALDALEKGLIPKIDKVTKYTVPDKKSKHAFCWFTKEYSKRLKCSFPNHYKSRSLDRALWVYGHLFKTDVKGKCCD